MPLRQLSLASIPAMDEGQIGVAFDMALDRALADMRDRPGVKKPRVVTLKVEFLPNAEGGSLGSATVKFSIGETAPKRGGAAYNMKATREGLYFNELNPEDVNQLTLDDVPAPKSTSGTVPEAPSKEGTANVA